MLLLSVVHIVPTCRNAVAYLFYNSLIMSLSCWAHDPPLLPLSITNPVELALQCSEATPFVPPLPAAFLLLYPADKAGNVSSGIG